jgi:hypothetical protein
MEEWRRGKGLVLLGRTEAGGRAGLIAPRECRRVALDGSDFCEIHDRQRDVMNLYLKLLGPLWKYEVERWEREALRRTGGAAGRS